MRLYSGKMKFFALWILLVGLVSSVLAQGNVRRVLRVRKTGEFGRRIVEPLATFYQPPSRHFRITEPTFQVAETRRSDNIFGIMRPSQKLELPLYTQPDQEAEETGDSPQGYAYSPAVKGLSDNTPPPVPEYPNNENENEEQAYEPDPNPVTPQREAEDLVPIASDPFAAEREENIDADYQNAQDSTPQKVQNSPVADQSAQCGENDHDCWPGGLAAVIPGDAGTDYPVLSEIIDTGFDCETVPYSGYYADADDQTRCQVFHVCLKGNQYRKTQKWSFLCPNGTVFSQNDFVCVWWYNAPECNSGNINELSLRNAELGWDNLTEANSGSSNFDVKSAMDLFNTNLQSSSSNSRLKNALPDERQTTRRPSTTTRTTNPYRIPVKVNTGSGARTKLKEIPNNSLPAQNDPEVSYDGEESETYETSLRHQSEARHKTKTASALSKSESEAYEQKSVPDSLAISPFISNRGPTGSEAEKPNYDIPLQGEYQDEEQVRSVVMMSAQKKNPDGSEGYAEVPVLMTGNGGYRYPNPTSTPGPKYLPPQNEYSLPSTTESPTTTTQSPVTEESYDSEGGYQYQSTEQPAQPQYSAQLVETTTEQSGYTYQNPTTTEESGYTYQSPSTTEQSGYSYPSPAPTEQPGYSYPAPTTTEQSGYTYRAPTTTFKTTYAPTTTEATYQEEFSSPVYEETDGGYGYESTAAPLKAQPTTTPPVTTTTLATTTSQEPSDGYLPPKTEGGYESLKTNAALQVAADGLTLPNEESADDEQGSDDGLPLSVTTSPDSDYTDGPVDLSGLDGNEVTDGEGTLPYHLPTPASSPAGATAGDNLDSQDKVSRILKEIQEGGAEVRDESGRKIDFAELQKLILSTPNGLLALQKADDSTTPDSAASSSTEVPSTTIADAPSSTTSEEEEEVATTSEEPKGPVYETVQPIEDYTNNRPVESPFSPQTNYFENTRLEHVDRPTFKVSAPSREYENHSVEQNSIDTGLLGQQQQSGGTFTGFSSSSYETQRQTNYQSPQSQFTQNFIPTQQTPNNQVYYQPQSQQQQQQPQGQTYRVQQPEPEVTYLRPSVPQPERYYEQSQQQQSNSQSQNAYYQQQEQQQSQSFKQINPNSETFYQSPQQQSQSIQQSQPQQQQQAYFQQQREPEPVIVQNQYLPPQPSTSQSQIYQPLPTQSRAIVSPPRDLTNNIQLQQSYNIPLPQASTNSRKIVNPVDIKIVPALFVHQHTRVEEPNGSPVAQQSQQSQRLSSNLNQNSNNGQFRQFSAQPSSNAFSPYASNTDLAPVTVRAPRFTSFSKEDALPKYEPFTAEDGRSAEQIQQYHHSDLRKFQRQNNARKTQSYSSPTSETLTTTTTTTRHPSSFANARRNGRHYIGSSGSQGDLGLLPSEERSPVSNYYPGRDGSLGVSLTYN